MLVLVWGVVSTAPLPFKANFVPILPSGPSLLVDTSPMRQATVSREEAMQMP